MTWTDEELVEQYRVRGVVVGGQEAVRPLAQGHDRVRFPRVAVS